MLASSLATDSPSAAGLRSRDASRTGGTEVKMGPPRSLGCDTRSVVGLSSRCRSSAIENCRSLPSSFVATSSVRARSGSARVTTSRVGESCQSEVSSRHKQKREG